MPKLLQINTVANRGSTGRIAEEIGIMAQSHGWDSYIAYGKRNPSSKNHLIRIQGKWGFYWHVLMSRLFGLHGYSSYLATKRFVKTIKKLDPDIIHLHNIHGYYLHIPTLFKYLSECGKPIVWTLHDCWAFTGHCTHFVNANCNKWKTECNNCPLYKEYPNSLFFDRSRQNYLLKKELFNSVFNLHLIPVSLWLKNLLKSSFLKNQDIRVIYNGIDLNIFKPKEDKCRNYKFTILGVASYWNDSKGLSDYIKLSRYLKDDEIIVLIGLTEVQKKGLPSNVIGITRTENQIELAEFYRRADVVTSLSYGESFGMTIIEAKACGTPVIAYNNTGQSELVDNPQYLVPTGDIEDLYKAIKHLRENRSSNKEYYTMLSSSKFDKVSIYKEYVDLYENLYNNNML